MREILFRGKRVDNDSLDGWHYGDLIHTTSGFNVVRCKQFTVESSYEVIPETVGQFTGLTDKNGVKIFEGDNILVKDHSYKPSIVYNGIVEWRQTSFMLNTGSLRNSHWNSGHKNVELEVIGTVHDK